MKNRFWSDNPYDWGIIPLSCLVPTWKDMFEERNKEMTDEQKRKLESFSDLMLLIQLSIAFGNTPEVDLGSYHRTNLMMIFEDLNLDHIEDLP